MLPSNTLSRFTIVNVESNAETLFIHLDEIASADYVNAPNIESKGFLAPVTVRDFPIRDKAVDLIVRRRRKDSVKYAPLFMIETLQEAAYQQMQAEASQMATSSQLPEAQEQACLLYTSRCV